MPKTPLNVIDLFAGAGGLSLGASRAGFNVIGAVEWDKNAMMTHKKNFPNTMHLQEDITLLTAETLLEAFSLSEENLCGIIGGPPCQGFSSIGHGDISDSRNDLFIKFFYYVEKLQPQFFIAENVPGILNPKYDNIRKKAFSQLRNYVLLAPLEIKANEYGAPTTRTRIFFIGYKKQGIISSLTEDCITAFRIAPEQQISVREALKGLPSCIRYSKNSNGLIKISTEYIEASLKNRNDFHYRVVGNIPDGVGNTDYIQAYQDASIVSGMIPTNHSKEVEQRYRTLAFGKQDKVSKSVKLNPDGFCPTIRAGTGPDKGSYQAVRPIHYKHARVITPREAARLQGFPDWFGFSDTIWHSFRQIGNSVSPIVAERILCAVHQKLTL